MKKFRNIHREIPALESFSNHFIPKICKFIKKEVPTHVLSCEHLRTAASVYVRWNFATTQTFMNKNNYIFLNVKK